MTPDERVDVKLREIKHVLVQMISLSKLGRLKLGEAQQAYQDVDGDLSKVSTREGIEHQSWARLQTGSQDGEGSAQFGRPSGVADIHRHS